MAGTRQYKRNNLGQFSKMAMSAKRPKKKAKRRRWPKGMPLPRVTNETAYNYLTGQITPIR